MLNPLSMGMLLGGLMGKGGSTSVSQSSSNVSSATVAFSTVTNVGAGGVQGTQSPVDFGLNGQSSAGTGYQPESYPPALDLFGDTPAPPTTVPSGGTTSASGSTWMLGLVGLAAAGVALMMLGGRRK